MVAEFARLLPRSVLDSELALLVKDTTTQLYATIADVVASGSAVLSVNSRVGHVELDKSDVGLADVENISPSALPISDQTQQALDTKWGKEAPIPQSAVENLPIDLAARVKTVNGNPPDGTGNVTIDNGQQNFILKPEDPPQDKEVLTWIVGIGWTPASIQEHLLLGAGNRLLPDPTTANPGDTVSLVDGAWAATAPEPLTLTSPDGSTWNLQVDNAGTITASKAV